MAFHFFFLLLQRERRPNTWRLAGCTFVVDTSERFFFPLGGKHYFESPVYSSYVLFALLVFGVEGEEVGAVKDAWIASSCDHQACYVVTT